MDGWTEGQTLFFNNQQRKCKKKECAEILLLLIFTIYGIDLKVNIKNISNKYYI